MSESQVGPWARDKLDRLGKYLAAYTTIMKEQKWCKGFVYIDAFAGPGEHEIRPSQKDSCGVAQALWDSSRFGAEQDEQREYVDGSPRVALEIRYPFSKYVFVEKSERRAAELEQLRVEFGGSRNISIRQEDCNTYLLDRAANVDWQSYRALAFLDPFGMQVPWQTLATLGDTGGVEVFLNFPVGMAIQRLLLRRGEFNEKQKSKLDEYFGSPEWFDVLYTEQPGLFGDQDPVKVENSGQILVKWYRKRLLEHFTCVSKAELIRNTKRGHLYYLMLATHKKSGLEIANHVLSAGETI
jgi:three-Cys-motif partner protein